MARLLAAVRRRIVRLVARHGIDLEQPSDEADAGDERLFECPAYAEIQGAAVVGRVATGPRAGAPVLRVGRERYATEITPTGPLHAHLEGFDLHAAVALPAGDRDRLEHLCRYVLRPPIAQERLELTAEGKVLLRLRRTWRDGTRAICFEPTELLEKLAAMIPKPRINLLVYHGVFAPHARNRPGAVRRAHEGARRHGTSPGAGSETGDAGTATTANGGTAHDSPAAPAPPRSAAPRGAGADQQAPATARPPPPAVEARRVRMQARARAAEHVAWCRSRRRCA